MTWAQFRYEFWLYVWLRFVEWARGWNDPFNLRGRYKTAKGFGFNWKESRDFAHDLSKNITYVCETSDLGWGELGVTGGTFESLVKNGKPIRRTHGSWIIG